MSLLVADSLNMMTKVVQSDIETAGRFHKVIFGSSSALRADGSLPFEKTGNIDLETRLKASGSRRRVLSAVHPVRDTSAESCGVPPVGFPGRAAQESKSEEGRPARCPGRDRRAAVACSLPGGTPPDSAEACTSRGTRAPPSGLWD